MAEIKIYKDEIAEKLDELSDLSEYWKKNREKGRTPNGVRVGMLALVQEINMLNQFAINEDILK